MPTNLREPKRSIREAKLNIREAKRNVRDLSVRDAKRSVRDLKRVVSGGFAPAEPEADLLVLDEVISFEDGDSREHQACLPTPYPTATTRWGCEL